MASFLVRDLSDAVHAALKQEARAQGRSVEAQTRLLLEQAVLPAGRFKLGTALARIGEEAGGLELRMLRDRRQPLVLAEAAAGAADGDSQGEV